MTTAAPVLDERLRAHGRLMLQIAGHLDNGQTIPCTGRNRDAWTVDEDREATAYAAAQCLRCPALRACRTYVDAFPEVVGVWAGLTPTDRKRKK